MSPGDIGNPDPAKQLAIDLEALSKEIGAVTSIVGLGKAGHSATTGETVDAAVGLAGYAADVPTSAPEVAGTILKFTAELGAAVAGKVASWKELNQFREVHVDAATYRATFELTWIREWTCVEGTWRCKQRLDVVAGPLTKGSYRFVKTVYAGELDGIVDRVSSRIKASIAAGAAKLQEASTPSERPCS